MNLSASIQINRAPEEVFAFISDVNNMPRWVTGVTKARLLSSGMAEGARFQLDYRQGWRSDSVELEVVEFDAPRTVSTKAIRGPFQFAGTVEVEAVEGGTRVTNTIEADADSLSTKFATVLLGPLLLRSMRNRLRRELDALSAAIKS